MSKILDPTGRPVNGGVPPLLGLAVGYPYPWREMGYLKQVDEDRYILTPTLTDALIVWIPDPGAETMQAVRDELEGHAKAAHEHLDQDVLRRLGAGSVMKGQRVVEKCASVVRIHGNIAEPQQPRLVK